MTQVTLPPLKGDQSLSSSRTDNEVLWAISQERCIDRIGTALEDPSDTPSAKFDVTGLKSPRAIDKSRGRVDVGGDFKMLDQQWECIVVGRDGETVHCELHDLTDSNNEAEYAEIYLNEFNEYDRDRLREGTVFYWSIGRLRKPHGQIIKFSELRLRPVPKMSRSVKRQIAERAKRLDGIIRRPETSSSTDD